METKRTLLHDLSGFHFEGLLGKLPDDIDIIDAAPAVRHCIGCYACWFRTPGRCAQTDRAQDFAPGLLETDELIIISRLCYGGFSPDVKAFMDRSIPNLIPFFRKSPDGSRTFHKRRGDAPSKLTCYFYSLAGAPPDSALVAGADDKRSLMEVATEHADDSSLATRAPQESELTLMRDIIKSVAFNMSVPEWSAGYVGDMSELRGVSL